MGISHLLTPTAFEQVLRSLECYCYEVVEMQVLSFYLPNGRCKSLVIYGERVFTGREYADFLIFLLHLLP